MIQSHYVHHTCSMEDELYHYHIHLSVKIPRIQITFLPQSVECSPVKHSLSNIFRTVGKVKGTYAPQMIKVGDVVLIHNDSPRTSWRMAVIENLIKGNDGYVRAAEVRTSSGRTNRPIARLYPLEITSEVVQTLSTMRMIINKVLILLMN